ncbi:MAG: hypothetical protein QGH15_01165 [Kiritimatiellia bacterium]|jgi:hypothetical protein|nr:hypothetical protein [Kiritimatiellia bacterium]
MNRRIKWILVHPWIAHAVSFLAMAALACPMYRRMGPGPGLVEYVLDSCLLAIRLPGIWLAMFIPFPQVEIALCIIIWGFTLWPLFRPRTKTWIGRAYLTFFTIWPLYAFGWIVSHLLARGIAH